jgi:hypothetical protein
MSTTVPTGPMIRAHSREVSQILGNRKGPPPSLTLFGNTYQGHLAYALFAVVPVDDPPLLG